MELQLRQQETPYGAETSHCMFQKPLVQTDGVLDTFDGDTVLRCYFALQDLAREQHGLEYLQVFMPNLLTRQEPALWFIEDDLVVTALLPSEY